MEEHKNEDGYCLVQSVQTKNKVILQSMALDFPANAVTAILGPSGSGKCARKVLGVPEYSGVYVRMGAFLWRRADSLFDGVRCSLTNHNPRYVGLSFLIYVLTT